MEEKQSTETPEQMAKRIREEVTAQMENTPPSDVPNSLANRFDTGSKKQKGNDNSGMMFYAKIVIIALIISFLVVEFVGVTPLNKSIKIINNAAQLASTNANNAKSEADTNTASITTIKTDISNIGGQINTLTASVTQLQNQLSGATTSSSSALQKVNDLSIQITTINKNIADLQTALGNANISQLQTGLTADQTAVASLQTTITALQNKLTTDEANIVILQKQTNLASITINTASENVSISNNVVTPISLSLTNSGTSDQTVPLTLTLTTSGSVSGITASMDRANTITVSGTTITYHVNIAVGANSTVNPNQSVTLVYTGTSPNSWTAVWSK